MSDEGVKIDVQRFLRIFLEEAVDHLATLENGLLRLEATPDDRSVIDDVFRAAHSLKGGSGTFGLQQVGRLTHVMESLLERVRSDGMAMTPALTSLLLRSTDELRGLLASADGGASSEKVSPNVTTVMAELEQAMGASGGHAPAASPSATAVTTSDDRAVAYRITFRPDANVFKSGGDPMLVLRELHELGEVSELGLDSTQLPALDALDPERSYLGWDLVLRTDHPLSEVRDTFAFVEDGSTIEITPVAPVVSAAVETQAAPEGAAAADGAKTQAARTEASIRVAIDKVDKLINLVGELVISQSMISQQVRSFTPEGLARLQEAVGEMERNIREMQERVMAVRMVPLSTVFSRVPRLVRDLAGTLGKKVNVQVTGGDTEIDKSVIERIGDPLTHLVRNAADHGIESPAERVAAGKPETGHIKLSAFHQGGNVVIHIEDDGKGLDTERIRKKAIERGLLRAEDQLSREEIHAFIFRAGFSTAEKVTDVSGRGVGMDVVRTNIESLNGTISLDSVKGKGTTLRISLPLTLAIIDGLIVGVGDEVYVVPLISIVESFCPKPDEIKTIGGRGEVVTVRGKVLPIVRLRRILAVGKTNREAPKRPLVVIIENGGAQVGLLVDDVQGQAQVVIKSLESNFRRIDGVMGATIMGDGRVALILDVQGLTRIGHRPRAGHGEDHSESRADAPARIEA